MRITCHFDSDKLSVGDSLLLTYLTQKGELFPTPIPDYLSQTNWPAWYQARLLLGGEAFAKKWLSIADAMVNECNEASYKGKAASPKLKLKCTYIPDRSWEKQKWYLLENGVTLCVEESHYSANMVRKLADYCGEWDCSDGINALPARFEWALAWIRRVGPTTTLMIANIEVGHD